MCGIVGGYYFNNSTPDVEKISRAVTALKHRGPDESDVHVVNNVAIGHSRLSIIDLSGGKQPLHNNEGNLHLVANGEVYNYVEVARQNAHISEKSLTQSDSEAILQAYESEGTEGFAQLNGMFAFALYDENARELILARDRLGIKPLFYCRTRQGIFFASEIKALIGLLDQSPQVNENALTQFLLHQFNTGRETTIEGIHRVLPGEYCVIKNDEISFNQYWDLTAVETRAPANFSYEEAFEEFEPLLRQVMKEHIRSDVPFGLFLSGGVDSSLILAELAKVHDQQLKTYSIGFKGTKMEDELDAATALANGFATDHTPIQFSRDDLFERIVHSIWAADELMRDYAALPTLMLSEVAAHDLKVVFSGEGGDEAFAGYRRYAPTLPRWINHRILGNGARRESQWKKDIQTAILTRSMQAQNTKGPLDALWAQTASNNWSLMNRRQYVDVKSALVDNLLVKTDRMMMAFGLEGRVPFSDHRIIEFGFSLPDRLKYKNGRGKWFLRQYAEKYLPKDHLQKPKRGFYVPVKEWFSAEFAKQLGQKLEQNQAVNTWLNINGVRQAIQQQINGKNCTRELYSIMQFAIWHKLFIEQPGVVPTKNENPLDWI